jgi:hypothetical protein
MKNYLQQHISELFLQFLVVFAVYGVQKFINLFNGILF